METATRKSTRKPAAKNQEQRIEEAYVNYVLQHGARPASVFKFCADLGLKEDQFYVHFGSFPGVERQIWSKFMSRTTARLKADKDYAGFSAREKILAFYYTLFEELKSSRSFILIQLEKHNRLEILPEFMKDFKALYERFIEGALNDGKTSGEIANRPYLDKRYPQLFWLHMAFLLMFWRDDSSAGFEKTDATIEKSVNLTLDLIGKGAVDTMIDFAKFLYQTKWK